MPDSRPGADRLNVAGPCQAHISNAVAMSHRSLADVTDNLHVGVAVQIEAAPGGNLVVVPDEERTHRSVFRTTLRSDFEMMSGIEPAEVTAIKCRRWTNLKHKRLYRDAAPPAALATVMAYAWRRDK